MEYFRIKNWDKYQHRDATRNGRMPWFKVYCDILDDPKICSLSPPEMGILVRTWALAGALNNKIPLDRPYLRPRLAPVKYKKALDLQFMWDLDIIEAWTASLDTDIDKTKTKTYTAPAARQPKTSYVNQKSEQKTGWKNPSQERLENNLKVAERAIERGKKND